MDSNAVLMFSATLRMAPKVTTPFLFVSLFHTRGVRGMYRLAVNVHSCVCGILINRSVSISHRCLTSPQQVQDSGSAKFCREARARYKGMLLSHITYGGSSVGSARKWQCQRAGLHAAAPDSNARWRPTQPVPPPGGHACTVQL